MKWLNVRKRYALIHTYSLILPQEVNNQSIKNKKALKTTLLLIGITTTQNHLSRNDLDFFCYFWRVYFIFLPIAFGGVSFRIFDIPKTPLPSLLYHGSLFIQCVPRESNPRRL